MKKMNNKGFSLVELIVVVAIMAILIGVLAPQYLRYVEKTRLQKDNNAIGEIANTIKIALAEEKVHTDTNFASWNIPASGGSGTNQTLTFTATGTNHLLDEELAATVGDTYVTVSNAYKDATAVLKITISNTNGVVEVKVDNFIESVGETPAQKVF